MEIVCIRFMQNVARLTKLTIFVVTDYQDSGYGLSEIALSRNFTMPFANAVLQYNCTTASRVKLRAVGDGRWGAPRCLGFLKEWPVRSSEFDTRDPVLTVPDTRCNLMTSLVVVSLSSLVSNPTALGPNGC